LEASYPLACRVNNEIIRAVARLGIDYIRWTQLVPMLAAWGLLLLALLAIAFTSFEEQGTAALETVFAVIGGIYALLPDSVAARSDNGSLELSGDDLIALASWAWFALAAFAMLVNWLVGERLRPRFLATLSGRIKTAGILAASISVLLLAIRVIVPENFNGSVTAWLPTLIGGPLVVWILSVYSLSISALLSAIEARLDAVAADV
jgi:hypothetical protein